MHLGLVYDCVYPYTLGGVEHRNAEIARRLSSQHTVSIFGFNYWHHDISKQLPNVEYVSIGTARDLHAGDGKRKIIDSLAAALGTFRALMTTKAEVWDLANIAVLPVFSAWLAAKLRRRGLVVTWHEYFGDTWRDYLGPRLGFIARRLERLALRCSPQVIAISPLTRDRILAAGYPAKRLHYIPNGVDTTLIQSITPASSGSTFVTAGRLTPHKRVHLAIDALAILRRTHPDFTLCIIGDGPERPRLETLVQSLDLQNAVTFHGFLPTDAEVFAVMKACHVALLPSAREGFGLSAVQAWACGIPVVVCDDPENATAGLVTDDRLGRVVPADPKQIAAASVSLMETLTPLPPREGLGEGSFPTRHVSHTAKNPPPPLPKREGSKTNADWRSEHVNVHYSFDAMIKAVQNVYDLAHGDRR